MRKILIALSIVAFSHGDAFAMGFDDTAVAALEAAVKAGKEIKCLTGGVHSNNGEIDIEQLVKSKSITAEQEAVLNIAVVNKLCAEKNIRIRQRVEIQGEVKAGKDATVNISTIGK